MKTMIAVPCMDSVPSQFAQSLAMLNKVGECSLAMQMSSLIYDSRNALAYEAIKRKADRVLWLDSDMVFPPDLLERMAAVMDEHSLDFLTGLYFRRTAPFTPVLYDKLETVDGKLDAVKTTSVPDGLFEVAGCGFGAVLMRTEVLMATCLDAGQMFEPMPGIGEDLAFCLRARKVGYKIICDPSITLGHVGHQVITRGFWEAYEAGRQEHAGKG